MGSESRPRSLWPEMLVRDGGSAAAAARCSVGISTSSPKNAGVRSTGQTSSRAASASDYIMLKTSGATHAGAQNLVVRSFASGDGLSEMRGGDLQERWRQGHRDQLPAAPARVQGHARRGGEGAAGHLQLVSTRDPGVRV